ncbi:MAG TPA: tripartite tricarboxylate transporter substrate-binding protein [Burkholderiales bacterium]|jgi:tripartite-type tricarboxylate transporter receptor subunit TctC|nr:tripartite tricarboxylate transporter substrate-binding protein [Burkholderiales bacterium]
MRHKVWALAAAGAAIALSAPVLSIAAQWPEKSVRLLVPFPPGGGTDIQARILSTAFQNSTGQRFIIDNRTGASGLIATQIAVESPPDGYTVLFTSGSIAPVKTLFAKRIKFDMFTDLEPISLVSQTPLVLTVHPSVPAKSAKELIALAKRTPKMNVGGNTAGTTAHLTAEMANQRFGLNSTVITYRGGGPAVIALISGEIDYIFGTAPSIMPHIRSGRARGLAVTTKTRSSALPDLPTMDSMYPGFISYNWYAMFYAKGTPKQIVDRMNSEIRKALATSEIKAFYPKQALDPVGSSPEELSRFFKEEVEKYAKVIKAANIRLE